MDSFNLPGSDSFPNSFSEIVLISSIAVLKMLRHGRAGIPIEVMGLILGKISSPTEIVVEDVFAMPQTGTGVSVEAIDPVFQTKMLDMLSQIGKNPNIIGWYHSHPGFGCWLSGVDINTQQSFEQLNKRSIALVIDPILSVKGKVVIEAFRNFPPFLRNQESREVNSFGSLIVNSTLQKEDHGVNKYYYGITINFSRSVIEDKLLISSLSWNSEKRRTKAWENSFPKVKVQKELAKILDFLFWNSGKKYTILKSGQPFNQTSHQKIIDKAKKILRYFLNFSLTFYIDFLI